MKAASYWSFDRLGMAPDSNCALWIFVIRTQDNSLFILLDHGRLDFKRRQYLGGQINYPEGLLSFLSLGMWSWGIQNTFHCFWPGHPLKCWHSKTYVSATLDWVSPVVAAQHHTKSSNWLLLWIIASALLAFVMTWNPSFTLWLCQSCKDIWWSAGSMVFYSQVIQGNWQWGLCH